MNMVESYTCESEAQLRPGEFVSEEVPRIKSSKSGSKHLVEKHENKDVKLHSF